MSYIIQRGRWCNITVLNVPAPTEDKIDDIKGRFYEELEQVFDKFPRYHMKISLATDPSHFEFEIAIAKLKRYKSVEGVYYRTNSQEG
jgi:hypothetical protein